ncbi:MAG: glycyl-radical enzyme activating protein [Candidatus Hodarchaeales archaeon]|jgi:pyruvate formate lyase activating enzyme
MTSRIKNEMKHIANIFDIKRYALHDGPGIRTTIFFKGCPLSCWWCHNPESQNLNPEKISKKYYRYKSPSIPSEEVIGREVNLKEVIVEIEKDSIFYDESGGGVTFSGGEPLVQLDFLVKLLDYCQENQIHTTLDTCGHASWENIEKIKDKVDLFLYDIKIIDEEKHQKYTGVSNALILSNIKRLDEEKKRIIIRFPIIPSITDTKENINQMIELLSNLKIVKKINLLPYHSSGKEKYKRLKKINRLEELESPSPEFLDELSRKFKNLGYEVKIGG